MFFSMVGIFVLMIAIINFINLSTARATKRAKEVGIRKSLGSLKKQLIQQFVFESVLQTILAVFVALIMVVLILPYFNALTEKSITLLTFATPFYVTVALVGTIFIGLFSGFYPCFCLVLIQDHRSIERW